MNLIELLKDSLHLLARRPKVFIPKLVTTGLYSICIIILMKLTLEVNKIASSVGIVEQEAIRTMLIPMLGYAALTLIFLIFIYFIDLLTYAMYPSIVRDYHEKKPISLGRALHEALKSWVVLLVLGIVIAILATSILFPFLYLMTFIWENFYLLILISFILIIIIIIFAILVFFVIPVAVIEKKGIGHTFKESFRLSFKHKGNVLRINLMFLSLTLLTLSLGMLSELKGFSGYLAITLFILVRFIQALIYTYISVINPYFYLRVR